MKKPPKPSTINLDALTGDLANLRELAGPEMMAAACVLLRERLKLTPEKLMLLIMRNVAPEEDVAEGEEAKLRGMSPTTLRDHKAAGLLPKVVNT